MADQWLEDYGNICQLKDSIYGDISERNRLLMNNAATSKASTTIRRKMSQMTSQLGRLDEDLHKGKKHGRLTDAEVRRRQDLIANLENELDKLDSMFQQGPRESQDNRDALIGGGTGGSRAWGAGVSKETDVTRDLNNQGVLGLQSQMMKDQDNRLDSLSEAISVTNKHAAAIGDELDVHSHLLDDIEGHTEKTTMGVRKENLRVNNLSEKVKTGGLWGVICILFLIIIILAVIPFSTSS